MSDTMDFIWGSDEFDYNVLRPLSHIRGNWELLEDEDEYKFLEEDDSFAGLLNVLVAEIDSIDPPANYHQYEDEVALFVANFLNWNIKKIEGRWTGAEYRSILEQGGFRDLDQNRLVQAAAGRIQAARNFGQEHFDDMERGHQKILANVLAIILYHREVYDRG